MADKLHGVFVVLVTPFNNDGNVDYQGMRRNVEWLMDKDIYGITVLGSTGEFASLNDEEREKAQKTVIDTVQGKIPVIVGASAETTEGAIIYATQAQKLGAAAVMISPPWYYTPDEKEIIHHYKAIATKTNLPIMVYNNPWSTKVDILPQTIARLCEFPGIDYVKESSADIRRITEIRMLAKDGICVFCGWEDLAYESFVMGAKGWICVAGNIAPALSVELFDVVVRQKDLERGRELYLRLLPLLRYIERSGRSHQVLKYVLDRIGLVGGSSSSPKLPLEETQKVEIDKLVCELGLSME